MDMLQSLEQRFKELKRYPYDIDDKLRMRLYKERMKTGIEIIEAAEKLDGLTCVCGKGCNACCRQLITVYPKEAEIAAEYLDSIIKGGKRAKFKRKLDEQIEYLADHGITAESVREISDRGGDEELALKEMYVTLGIPCPLLSEEGSCMIYPVRPVSCWDYRCYGDPIDCKGQISHYACSNEKISVPLIIDLLTDRRNEETYALKFFQTELSKYLNW